MTSFHSFVLPIKYDIFNYDIIVGASRGSTIVSELMEHCKNWSGSLIILMIILLLVGVVVVVVVVVVMAISLLIGIGRVVIGLPLKSNSSSAFTVILLSG